MRWNMQRWWRPAMTGGATIALLLALVGCGGSTPAATVRCTALAASTVPPMQKVITQSDTGTYCASPGTSILIVLKARDFSAASAWAQPSATGPTGGTHWLSPPMTSLRGTTVAAVQFDKTGTYQLTSTAGATTWHATIEVASK